MIRFRCKKCWKKLKADEKIIGRKVKCTICGKVARVPSEDNLTRPEPTTLARPDVAESSGELSFAWDEDDSNLESDPQDVPSGDSLMGNDQGDDDSLDLIGKFSATLNIESTISAGTPDTASGNESGKSEASSFTPKFKVVQRNSSALAKWLPFILAGVLVIAGGAWATSLLITYVYSGPRFGEEFEARPLVMDYRRAVQQLEKSDRFLMIAGQNVESGSEDEMTLNELHNDAVKLAKDSTVPEDAFGLFRAKNENAARDLLVKATKILDEKRFDIDQKTREFK